MPHHGLIWGLAALLSRAVEAQSGFPGMPGLENFNLNDLGGLGGDCSVPCPSGEALVPAAEDFRPYANGCSVPGFIKFKEDYDFTSCCNQHDVCYMSCGIDKKDCEKTFLRCLRTHCRQEYPNPTPPPQGSKTAECLQQAEMFNFGVSSFGCQGFKSSHEEACRCVPKAEQRGAMEAYLTNFFQQYNATKLAEDPGAVEHILTSSKYKKKYGSLLANLFRNYPDSIEILGTDGQARRPGRGDGGAKEEL